MAHINFVLPGNKSELLSENDHYYVKNTVGPKDLATQLKNAKTALQDEGVESIIDSFDVYYSVLHHGDTLPMNVIFKAYEILHKGAIALNKTLGFLLEDKESLNDEIKLKYLNIMKMMLYVYVQVVLLIEQKNEAKNQGLTLKGRKKFAREEDNYNIDKKNILLILGNIIQRDISLFWDPPLVEENFVNIISEVCYRFLQNPSIKAEKEIHVEIFSLIGGLIKSFNHGTTFVIRTVQLIKMHEQLVNVLPGGVHILVQTYGCKGLVHDLVREITEWQVDEKYQDSQGARFCALVLSEMAILMPDLMIPEVMYLNRYLAYESATLRNSVLNVIAEVILKVLTNHELSEDEKESRDELITILLEHMNDVASHVRSKVIQHCARLQKENAIPLKYQHQVLEAVIFHLSDKGALVRKSAISCVTTFLSHNLFSANLSLAKMQTEFDCKQRMLDSIKMQFDGAKMAKLEKLQEEWDSKKEALLAAVEEELANETPEGIELPKEQIPELIRLYMTEEKYKEAVVLCRAVGKEIDGWKQAKDVNENDDVDFYMLLLHSIFIDTKRLLEEIRTQAKMSEDDFKKMEALENAVEFLKDSVNFLKLIDGALTPMTELLETSAISDMQESLEFFIAAYQFNIDNSTRGIIEMLKIMQRNEQERKDLVINAFQTIYLSTDSKNMAEHTTTIVNRLVALLKSVPVENIDDLEIIIAEWTAKGVLDNSVIDMLWQYLTQKVSVSDEDSRASFDLLRMAAIGRRTIIQRNIKLVATIGFGERGAKDLLLLASSCDLLSVVGRDRIDITADNPSFKIKADDEMFKSLVDLLVDNFLRPVDYYSKALSSGVNFIYKLCSKPERLCEDLITRIMENLIKEFTETDEVDVDKIIIIRLCHMLGNVAVKHLDFLDETVYKELKRRQNIREERKEAKRNVKSTKKKNKRTAQNASSTTMNESALNSTLNDESTLEGAQAEDTDAEFILNVLENDTVLGSGGLGKLVYIIKGVCERPDLYDDAMIQGPAVVALIRYMLVSSKFCENHIQLLFTIFEKTKYAEVKCSILVHCSDLLTRFPNVVEPWTPRMYLRLKDPDDMIRKATFFTLSNLILRDMIRAHSHISEMVCCLVDEDQELSGMCKTFLVNLSHKENNLYNVLPDIFTHLMELESMSEDNARGIMKFLFELMDKTKHMENLVDRFCCKFRLTEDLRQHQNITYCLTLIHYNEKALKKLQENFLLYKHLVHDSEIYGSFKNIFANCNKQQVGKADLRPVVTELESLINSVFEINEDGGLMKPPPPPKSTKKRRKSAAKKKPPRKKQGSDSEEDFEDSEKENDIKNTPARRSNRNRSVRRRLDDSDSD